MFFFQIHLRRQSNKITVLNGTSNSIELNDETILLCQSLNCVKTYLKSEFIFWNDLNCSDSNLKMIFNHDAFE